MVYFFVGSGDGSLRVWSTVSGNQVLSLTRLLLRFSVSVDFLCVLGFHTVVLGFLAEF